MAAQDGIELLLRSDNLDAAFSWSPTFDDAQGAYTLYCRYPDADTFVVLMTNITGRQCSYHFGRQLCGDTVLFVLKFCSPADTFSSQVVGAPFDDRSPTTPCLPAVVTADGLSTRVTWHPSPDLDVMGYYVCSGKPSVGYDTVWGRLDTSLLCADHLAAEQHFYRVLAFDSCYRASALSDYFCNVALTGTTQPCVRHIDLQWTPVEQSGMQGYDLLLQFDTLQEFVAQSFGSSEQLSFAYDLPDSVSRLSATVRLLFADGSEALSNTVVYYPSAIDSARYLRITASDYDMLSGAVVLDIEADSLFQGGEISIYRAADSGVFQLLDVIPYCASCSYYDYTATAVDASYYTYYLSVMDLCGVRQKLSAVSHAFMPSMQTRGAIFPNVFTPSRIDNNMFCGQFRFVDHSYYDLYIYNRYGMLVFHSSSPAQCWDGTHQGRVLPQGVYVYILRCRFQDGALNTQTGSVLLLD